MVPAPPPLAPPLELQRWGGGMDPLPLESYPEFNAQTKSNDMLTLYTSVFLDIKQGMCATLKNMFPTVSPEALDVIFKHDRNLKIYYLTKNVLHIQNFFYILV